MASLWEVVVLYGIICLALQLAVWQSFADLDKAQAFFESECDEIGAPVSLCSVEDKTDAVHCIESYEYDQA
jgi:hypothetical protein